MEEPPRPAFKWLWISIGTVLFLAVVLIVLFVYLVGSTPMG